MTGNPTKNGQPRLVLLIEDNPGDAYLIREMLQETRNTAFTLEWEAGLTAGMDRLARGGVEAVLLDLSLPESQGLESLVRIHGHRPGVPVVVLTGSTDEELGNRAVQAGAQDYLVKGHVDGHTLGRALRYAIERGRIEEELRRRVAQLAEMDRRKDEFLATLAHELRNPLAPIANTLHILRISGQAGPTAQHLHEMMERQVKHMVRLVDDLLEVSRITRGKIELRKERVTLAAIVNSAVETSRHFIDAAHHELTLTVPPEPIILEADPVRLSQVIANLLNNAAKYTEEGGRIWVTAQQQGGEAVLRVRDNGLGIPAAMLGHIFDMFAQVDRTLKRSQGGLGIGLALARTLVQMHGGRIEVHSEGTGLGAEFTVHLPLAPVEPAPAAVVPGESAQPALRTQRRVLIVDDNRDAAESLGMLLNFLGADVAVVYDGPSALDTARAYRPAIVLMDIGMPGMDGHEVARRLRADPAQRDVTLIALSGWGQEEDRRRSQAAGFDHHLVKPVDTEALQALLTESASKKPGS